MILTKRLNLIIFFFVLVTMWIVVLASVFKNDVAFDHPKIKSGILDLSNWDFEEKHTIDLNGKWAFYWGKFLKSTDKAQPDFYIDVPNNWDRYQLNGN